MNEVIDQDLEVSAIHYAADKGNLGMLELLLDKGANVNLKTGVRGNTALHIAATAGNM